MNNSRINYLLTFEYALVQGLTWTAFPTGIAFATNHMLALGLTSIHSGIMLALANISGLIFQPLLAERSDTDIRFRPSRILVALMALVCVSSLAQALFSDNKSVALIFGSISAIALVTSTPFVISLKYEMADDEDIPFGPCRAIGSIFYAVAVSLLGRMIEAYGIVVVPILGTLSSLLLVVLVFFIGKSSRRRRTYAKASNAGSSQTMLSFLKENPLLTLLAVGIGLLFFAHNVYNNFTINIVGALGGSDTEMGFIVALAAALELPVMFAYKKISSRISITTLLQFSLVMFLVKAIATYLAKDVAWLSFAYSLQVFAFALYTPASVDYAQASVEDTNIVKAQAAFTMAQIAGGVFSSVFGASLIVSFGVNVSLGVSALISLVGSVIALFALRERSN